MKLAIGASLPEDLAVEFLKRIKGQKRQQSILIRAALVFYFQHHPLQVEEAQPQPQPEAVEPEPMLQPVDGELSQ